MYSFYEILIIFQRCKNIDELERAIDGLLFVKEDGDLSYKLSLYAESQSKVRFRQLKT
jgi:hypothetical protein